MLESSVARTATAARPRPPTGGTLAFSPVRPGSGRVVPRSGGTGRPRRPHRCARGRALEALEAAQEALVLRVLPPHVAGPPPARGPQPVEPAVVADAEVGIGLDLVAGVVAEDGPSPRGSGVAAPRRPTPRRARCSSGRPSAASRASRTSAGSASSTVSPGPEVDRWTSLTRPRLRRPTVKDKRWRSAQHRAAARRARRAPARHRAGPPAAAPAGVTTTSGGRGRRRRSTGTVRPVIPPTSRTVVARDRRRDRGRGRRQVGDGAGRHPDRQLGRSHVADPQALARERAAGCPGGAPTSRRPCAAGPREEKPLRTENQWRPAAGGHRQRHRPHPVLERDVRGLRASPRRARPGP